MSPSGKYANTFFFFFHVKRILLDQFLTCLMWPSFLLELDPFVMYKFLSCCFSKKKKILSGLKRNILSKIK